MWMRYLRRQFKEREKEAEAAVEIIQGEVEKFNNWIVALDAVPTIVQIRNKAEAIRKEELEKTLKKMPHLSDDDKNTLRQMAASITNKILHKPTVNLKRKTQSQDGHVYLKAIRHLFHLDD